MEVQGEAQQLRSESTFFILFYVTTHIKWQLFTASHKAGKTVGRSFADYRLSACLLSLGWRGVMQQMAKLCIRNEYRNNKQNIVYIHTGHSKFIRKTGLWKHILCTRAHTIHFQYCWAHLSYSYMSERELMGSRWAALTHSLTDALIISASLLQLEEDTQQCQYN